MKKIVLVLVALASLSFASEKKEDCMKYIKNGDYYLDGTESKSGHMTEERKLMYSNIATANYLRYQICKDLQKKEK